MSYGTSQLDGSENGYSFIKPEAFSVFGVDATEPEVPVNPTQNGYAILLAAAEKAFSTRGRIPVTDRRTGIKDKPVFLNELIQYTGALRATEPKWMHLAKKRKMLEMVRNGGASVATKRSCVQPGILRTGNLSRLFTPTRGASRRTSAWAMVDLENPGPVGPRNILCLDEFNGPLMAKELGSLFDEEGRLVDDQKQPRPEPVPTVPIRALMRGRWRGLDPDQNPRGILFGVENVRKSCCTHLLFEFSDTSPQFFRELHREVRLPKRIPDTHFLPFIPGDMVPEPLLQEQIQSEPVSDPFSDCLQRLTAAGVTITALPTFALTPNCVEPAPAPILL